MEYFRRRFVLVTVRTILTRTQSKERPETTCLFEDRALGQLELALLARSMPVITVRAIQFSGGANAVGRLPGCRTGESAGATLNPVTFFDELDLEGGANCRVCNQNEFRNLEVEDWLEFWTC